MKIISVVGARPNFMKIASVSDALSMHNLFLKLVAHASVVLTDSGGIQEETTVLGIPCLTLRENTERPVTITHGTNKLAGTDPEIIIKAFSMLNQGNSANPVNGAPEYWDGKASKRIVEYLSLTAKEDVAWLKKN